MTTKEAGLVETVKNGIAGAVKGSGDVAKATAVTVGCALSTTLEDACGVGRSAAEAIGHVGSPAVGAVRPALTRTISDFGVAIKAPFTAPVAARDGETASAANQRFDSAVRPALQPRKEGSLP